MKRTVFIIFSLALLAACGQSHPPLGWRESFLSESTKTYRISGSYPVIVGLSEPDQTDVNVRIKQLIEETLADFRRTSAAISEARLKGRVNTLSIAYERATLTSDIVSFSLNIESSIAGAAHPNVYVRTFNYDLSKHIPLSINDLFPDADKGLQTLSEKTAEVLTAAAKVRGTYDDNAKALIAAGTAPQAENFNAFLMESGSVIILFSPYQVAPGSEGTQRVSVPLNSIR